MKQLNNVFTSPDELTAMMDKMESTIEPLMNGLANDEAVKEQHYAALFVLMVKKAIIEYEIEPEYIHSIVSSVPPPTPKAGLRVVA
ncbi:MAG: hypothetical protein ACYTFZ_00250 [Planctomycetota bacterium]|jgi:hypothetical protein